VTLFFGVRRLVVVMGFYVVVGILSIIVFFLVYKWFGLMIYYVFIIGVLVVWLFFVVVVFMVAVVEVVGDFGIL